VSGRAATTVVQPGDVALAVGDPGTKPPEGWAWVPLRKLAEMATGHTPSRRVPEYWGGDIPWISVKDARLVDGAVIYETRENTNRIGIENSAAVVLPPNTVCLSRTASIGYSVRLGRPMATSQGFVNWRCGEELLPEYLQYLFLAENRFLKRIAEGAAQTSIYLPAAKAFHVCVPSLAMQRRIVEVVKATREQVARAVSGLHGPQRKLERLLQSVLREAFSGRLTQEWRESRVVRDTALEELEEIRQAVTSNGTSRELRYFEELIRAHPPSRDEELPSSWARTQIGHMGHIYRGSTPARKEPAYWGGEIPWVSSGEVRNNVISESRERISDQGLSNSSCRLMPPGSVLVALSGEGRTRGQSAVLDINACFNQSVAAIDLSHGRSNSLYLRYWLQYRYQDTRQSGSGSAQRGLSTQRVRELPLHLAPLREQIEIVRRIDEVASAIQNARSRSSAMIDSLGQLERSVLRRAFAGELVPTAASTRL